MDARWDSGALVTMRRSSLKGRLLTTDRLRETVNLSKKSESVDVGFIRLLPKSRIEEEVAHRWRTRLGKRLGSCVRQLRPGTTLSEMMEWAANVTWGAWT